jgi:TRAP-type C4-dicarboxylate transport system permease large subunit
LEHVAHHGELRVAGSSEKPMLIVHTIVLILLVVGTFMEMTPAILVFTRA